MNEKRNGSQPHSGGLALNDIYYVLFRQKWKIIILSSIGLLVALGIFCFRGTTYLSEADVWIKYVMSNKPQGPMGTDGQTIMPDVGGDGIINTEVAILNSFDLAVQVATNIGPDKILAMSGGGSDRIQAASLIHENLTVDRIPRSPVLRLIFSHPDKDLVQRILQEIVADYKTRHEQMHASADSSSDVLQERTSSLKRELDQTEETLQKLKSSANVSDLGDARKADAELILQTRQQIALAQYELAQHNGELKKLKEANSDLPAAAVIKTNAPEPEIPQDKVDEYTDNNDYIDQLKKDYITVRSSHPATSTYVVEAAARLDDAKKKKKKMELEEPRLAKLKVTTPKASAQSTGPSTADLITAEETLVASLEDKIKFVQEQLNGLHSEITNLDAVAPAIRDWERKAQYQETIYKNYLLSYEQSRIENDIGATKNANIQVTQEPRPPTRERSKTPKMMGIAALAGILAGLAWAFFIELYLDHSVRRPKELEGNMGLRLFLSIPEVERNGKRLLTQGGSVKADANGKAAKAGALLPTGQR